jgi:glycerol kinase
VEQEPGELWKTALAAAETALLGSDPRGLRAIAVTNQRESVLIWERKSGRALGPCVSWQCRRSAPFIASLRTQGLEETVRSRTGLTLDPMFSAGKARWLLDQIPDGQARAAAGELCFGTVDAWMLWNLTGGAVHACDMTNASRTQLFNLHSLDWDDDLLAIFGIPRAILPEVRPSGAHYGVTCQHGSLPAGIPIASLIGDSHGALFGHAGFTPGSIKATYGTGSSLMMPTPQPVFSQHGLSTSLAWGYNGATFALEGNIYVTGAGVQWLYQFLGLKSGDEIEALAGQLQHNEGVYFVPALVGLGAPYWDADARGQLSGITRGTGPAHAARAAIEAIAYQIHDVFAAMHSDTGQTPAVLLADGGAARNNLLMQFQADILDVPVVRSRSSDLSALGAAYLAGLACGLWQSFDEISQLPRPQDRFEPHMTATQRGALLSGWQDAVRRTSSRL